MRCPKHFRRSRTTPSSATGGRRRSCRATAPSTGCAGRGSTARPCSAASSTSGRRRLLEHRPDRAGAGRAPLHRRDERAPDAVPHGRRGRRAHRLHAGRLRGGEAADALAGARAGAAGGVRAGRGGGRRSTSTRGPTSAARWLPSATRASWASAFETGGAPDHAPQRRHASPRPRRAACRRRARLRGRGVGRLLAHLRGRRAGRAPAARRPRHPEARPDRRVVAALGGPRPLRRAVPGRRWCAARWP